MEEPTADVALKYKQGLVGYSPKAVTAWLIFTDFQPEVNPNLSDPSVAPVS
jgi:hypothetical protein